MIKLNIILNSDPSDDRFIGENFIKRDIINLYLNKFKFRKDISAENVAQKINHMYLAELFCLFAQKHQIGFLKKCNGGKHQDRCKIDIIMDFMGLKYWKYYKKKK